MIADNATFALTPTERTSVLDELGRNDAAALGFIADAEACLQAFDYAVGNGASNDSSDDDEERFETLARAVIQVQSALDDLPEDMAMLIDLYRLAKGARERIAPDCGLLIRPWQDTIVAIDEIRRSIGGNKPRDNTRLEARLILALANTYRSRLNRDPVSEDASGFSRVLSLILEFAGHRVPPIAAARAATTPMRLRLVLSKIDSPAPMIAGLT